MTYTFLGAMDRRANQTVFSVAMEPHCSEKRKLKKKNPERCGILKQSVSQLGLWE